MKEIKCELIIADTGSTDKTVEIAKEYTDKVFHFEWINDFSAARNSTLKKARGLWYMFIDADEYFEDAEQLILFLNNKDLRTKYKAVEMNVRSYTSEDMTNYSDANLPRLHRIGMDEDKDVEFKGKIHETIVIRRPYGNITTILHHTGYIFSSARQKNDKNTRNMPLMKKEFEENPDDLRILSHIIGGSSENEETEGYIKKALEIITQPGYEDAYKRPVFMQIVNYYKNSKPEYALEICEKYYECQESADEYVSTLGISAIRAKILSALARYEQAVKEFERYFRLYKLHKSEKLKGIDASAHPIYGATELEYEQYFYTAVLCYEKLRQYDKAYELLDSIDITSVDGEFFRNHLGSVRRLCSAEKNYTYMASCYDIINKTDDKEKKSLALYMLESTYYSLVTSQERTEFAESICKSGAEGQYIELMQLVTEQQSTDFKDRLKIFIDNVECWDDGYSEAIYLAVKNGIDISNAVVKMKPELIRLKLEEIAVANDDFAGLVLQYGIPETFFTSIKKFLWIVSLYEKASYRAFNLNDDDKYRLYSTFVSLLGDYVMNIYNPELLNDEDVEVISNYHQFGYHMFKANEYLSLGNSIEYIRELKKGLVSCESMKEIVQLLMEQFKKNM